MNRSLFKCMLGIGATGTEGHIHRGLRRGSLFLEGAPLYGSQRSRLEETVCQQKQREQESRQTFQGIGEVSRHEIIDGNDFVSFAIGGVPFLSLRYLGRSSGPTIDGTSMTREMMNRTTIIPSNTVSTFQ